mmetsp:Transcript_11787/g.30089  ORF Transcript_11787/g.30089 Transcript_11787/m.30089 type:complete len:146 (+) Transcript_11787:305-742(+)
MPARRRTRVLSFRSRSPSTRTRVSPSSSRHRRLPSSSRKPQVMPHAHTQIQRNLNSRSIFLLSFSFFRMLKMLAFVSVAFSFLVLGISSGSANPSKEKVGSITSAQLKEIAEVKLPDLNCRGDIQAAMKIVGGTAANMGINIEDA